MGITISGSVGIQDGSVIGTTVDQERILNALHAIHFINAATSVHFMNRGTPEESANKWRKLIGDFQIQFIRGSRGVFASEQPYTLRFRNDEPDHMISKNGNTIRILNRMLDATLLISVSIDRQMAYVINLGSVTRSYSVTTGGVDNSTPVGLFRIYRLRPTSDTEEEARNYRSNLGAMPYPIYFTDNGHALHAGSMVPINRTNGSHGCVRQSRRENYSRQLWQEVYTINSGTSRDRDGVYLPASYVFVFERPNRNHSSRRRGDIVNNVFNRQQNIG